VLVRTACSRSARRAGSRHEARQRRYHRLVAGSEPERSAPTKRSERAVNEPRVEREQRLRAESELFEDPRAQILDERVDAFEVLDEPRHSRGVPQVERDEALARAGGVEDERELVEERRAPAPRLVAALGPPDVSPG